MYKDNTEGTEMGKTSLTPSNKRFHSVPLYSSDTTSSTSPKPLCCTAINDILISIENKLSGLDARITLIVVLHKEFLGPSL